MHISKRDDICCANVWPEGHMFAQHIVESHKVVPTSSLKVSPSRAGQVVSLLELSPSFQ